MPWKETCAVDQRVALLADWLRGEWTMTELAARYGITRKTGYKWVGRYEAEGAGGLMERSRAAAHPGRAIAAEERAAILALRRGHPHWGSAQTRGDPAGAGAAASVASPEHDGRAAASGRTQYAAAATAVHRAAHAAVGRGRAAE
jgi:hypothetical protein